MLELNQMRKTCWLAVLSVVACVSCLKAQTLPSTLADVDYKKHMVGFFESYCFDCHSNDKQKADVNLQQFETNPLMYQDRKFWEAVRDMLELREMPPEKKEQPSEADRAMAVLFIDHELSKFDCSGPVNPGRVTIRRLNRVEYRNTIRDLIGVEFDPAAELPLDEVGYGFDNIGDVLSLPPILMEKYLKAADRIVEAAIVTDESTLMPRVRLAGGKLEAASSDIRLEGRTWGLFREGEVRGELNAPRDGEYLIQVESFGDQAGGEPPKMEVKVDGERVTVFEVPVTEDRKKVYEVKRRLTRGAHSVAFGYLNNFNSNGDRNLFLNYVELVGPVDGAAPEYPPAHRRIIPNQPAPGQALQAARTHLADFARRAYRRPVSNDELDRLVAFVEAVMKEGGNYNEGMQVAATAVLVSPHFLYRWELDAGAASPEDGDGQRLLNDYELASRLSYFLWSSMPDEALLGAAAQGLLGKAETLETQVRRMLDDPKSWALIENFAGQWLQVRNLDISPDPKLFPEFDEDLRRAMKMETQLFVQEILRQDRSLLDLLNADFTYVNERLARHYGIEGIEGEAFQRVNLKPEHHRGGLLTQASILALTSNPTRTSPVNRGKWILEQILGAPPPPPPPNVPELAEGTSVDLQASLRKRMEQHRDNPDCSSCHDKMDPLGFAFENFDAIGAWRDRDGHFEIDASGTMPDGRPFRGPEDLKRILQESEGFARTVTEKMLTYALGRGLEYYDQCAVEAILAELKKNDYKLAQLVLQIVRSAPFQRRSTGNES